MIRPLFFVAIAPFFALLAAVCWYGGNDEEERKALARSRPPPPETPIESFDRARHQGASGEVVVLGQLDMGRLTNISIRKNGKERDHYVIAPIYPVGAKERTEAARGVLVQIGELSTGEIRSFTVGEGPIGPLVRLNGELLSRAEASEAMEEGFDGKVAITRDRLYIDPYDAGRDAALAPSTNLRGAAFFFLGLALLSVTGGAFAQWLLARRERAESDGYYGTRF